MINFAKSVRETYHNSLKTHDISWNTYVIRPLAAILVVLLCRTKLTPNQVTILGALLFTSITLPLILVPALAPSFALDHSILLMSIAALLIEIAYIFDAVDGQLARYKKMTSEIGAYFDFLIDEVKALLLPISFSSYLYFTTEKTFWLFIGLGGTFIVSTATSLTNFIRRKEYTGGEEVKPGASAIIAPIPKSLVGKVAWLIKRSLSFIVHYPSWIWILPILEILFYYLPDTPFTLKTAWRLPVFINENMSHLSAATIFLALYLGVYLLYFVRTSLVVILKLGSPKFYHSKH